MFEEYTFRKVGFKAAGGLKTAQDAITWLELVEMQLGSDWMNPISFRIGASSLLADLEKFLIKTVDRYCQELKTKQIEPIQID